MKNMNNKNQVIVIEDDEDVRFGCVQTIKLESIPAQGVGSVEQLTDLDVRHYPGIIVTDIRLPGMSGLDYLHQLMQIDPELPVIVITGHGNEDTATQAREHGAFDYLEKPFRPEKLINVIQSALDQRHQVMANRNG